MNQALKFARPILTRQGFVEDDTFFLDDNQPLSPGVRATVSLDRFLDLFAFHDVKLGVRIEPDNDPRLLEHALAHVAIIEVHFPTFADGRGYTHARRLREQLGFSGELRAVGDVGPDQLHYLARAGFSSFALRAGVELEDARRALDRFTYFYAGIRAVPNPLTDPGDAQMINSAHVASMMSSTQA